jgi:hypothetical protein
MPGRGLGGGVSGIWRNSFNDGCTVRGFVVREVSVMRSAAFLEIRVERRWLMRSLTEGLDAPSF